MRSRDSFDGTEVCVCKYSYLLTDVITHTCFYSSITNFMCLNAAAWLPKKNKENCVEDVYMCVRVYVIVCVIVRACVRACMKCG